MAHIDPNAALRLKNGKAITGMNYADEAEAAIKALQQQPSGFGRGRDTLTTSSLRGIYSLVMNVYTEIDSSADFEAHRSDLQYLKVRMAYEAGRKESVRKFLDITSLKDAIDAIATFDQFLLYCRYAESLVAYFKFYGGKDR